MFILYLYYSKYDCYGHGLIFPLDFVTRLIYILSCSGSRGPNCLICTEVHIEFFGQNDFDGHKNSNPADVDSCHIMNG